MEPLALPVWQELMNAYPPNHFSLIIRQIAEALEDEKDDLYDQMIQMVKDSIDKNTKQWERALDIIRVKNKTNSDDLLELRKEIETLKLKNTELLQQQEIDLTEMHEQYLQKELEKIQKQNDLEKKRADKERLQALEEIDRLKRSNEYMDLKITFFKWRQSGFFMRFYEQLSE